MTKTRPFTKPEKLFLFFTMPIGIPMLTFMFAIYFIPTFIYRVYQRVQEKLKQEDWRDREVGND